MRLVATDETDEVLAELVNKNEDAFNNYESKRAFEIVKGKIDYKKWTRLVHALLCNLQIVYQEHPLQRYAIHSIPKLEKADREKVAKALLCDHCSSSSSSVIRLMKDLQEVSPPPRAYGVLFKKARPAAADDDAMAALELSSCLPNVQLEFIQQSSLIVQLTALFDINDDEAVSLCRFPELQHDSVEEREAAVQDLTGHACACLRCRFELKCNDSSSFNSRELLRLARFYLSAAAANNPEESLEMVRFLYQQVIDRSTRDDTLLVAEAWHALGAIELTRNHFLRAQRLWKRAAETDPAVAAYPGIRLQLEKMTAYKYLQDQPQEPLEPATKGSPSERPSFTSDVPNAYVTSNMLDKCSCKQVISWAETQGEWTQQRHYAVPTHDVPVHTVMPLCEWFVDWMQRCMSPVLTRQFGCTSSSFFVHDAFCVRYQADTQSYLPIHTDESTHSLVVALNDDYEGGGTYLYEQDKVIRLDAGQVLSFRGDTLLHGGEAVTAGTRYILAVFLYHDDEDEDKINVKRRMQEQEGGPAASKKLASSQNETPAAATFGKSKLPTFSFQFDL